MATQGFLIEGLPRVATPATELPGALFEVETLTGPNGARENKSLTTEQFAAHLAGAPNLRPDAIKAVRWLTDAEAANNGGGATLQGLPALDLCLGTLCMVELYRPVGGPVRNNVLMQLVGDNRANPTVGLRAFRDGDFLPVATADGLVAVKWVLADEGSVKSVGGVAPDPATGDVPLPPDLAYTDQPNTFTESNTFEQAIAVTDSAGNTTSVKPDALQVNSSSGQQALFKVDGVHFTAPAAIGTTNQVLDLQSGNSDVLVPGGNQPKSAVNYSQLQGYQPSLGYTPENQANKDSDLSTADNQHYPTTGAVATALAAKENLSNKTSDPTANDNARYFTTAAVQGLVGAAVQGLAYKDEVQLRVVTLPGSTTLNTVGLATIQGYAIQEGDRIMYSPGDATSGIYIAHSGPWTRATDFDTTAKARRGTAWVLRGDYAADGLGNQLSYTATLTTGTLGTTAFNFQVNYNAVYTNGTGILLSGGTFSADFASSADETAATSSAKVSTPAGRATWWTYQKASVAQVFSQAVTVSGVFTLAENIVHQTSSGKKLLAHDGNSAYWYAGPTAFKIVNQGNTTNLVTVDNATGNMTVAGKVSAAGVDGGNQKGTSFAAGTAPTDLANVSQLPTPGTGAANYAPGNNPTGYDSPIASGTVAIGTGAKSCYLSTGLAYIAGDWITLRNTSGGSVTAAITTYDPAGGQVTFTVTAGNFTGSGTLGSSARATLTAAPYVAPTRQSLGVIYSNHVPQSANFTVDATADSGKVFEVTTGTGTITVTLPTASAAGNGFGVTVRKADTGAGFVSIGGILFGVQGHRVNVLSDGTNWILLPEYGGFTAAGGIVITGALNAATSFQVGGGSIATLTRDGSLARDNANLVTAVTSAGNTWNTYGDLTAFGDSSGGTPTAATNKANGAPPAVSGQDSSILVGTADVAIGDEFEVTVGNTTWRYSYGRRRYNATPGWRRNYVAGDLDFLTNAYGPVLRDSSGGKWRIGVSTSGALSTTQIS